MDFNQIKELIKMIDLSTLVDFDLDFENTKVSMKKAAAKNSVLQNASEAAQAVDKPQIRIENIKETIDAPTTIIPEPKPIVRTGNIVEAPLVGTFYSSVSPEKPPFVTVGSSVKKGDVLCIIEAMKIMNEITSKYDGVVSEILVNNEDMVEYGQQLFIIS